jgi:hypothetical protein
MKVRSTIQNVVFWISLGAIIWLVAGAIAFVVGAEDKIVWTCISGASLGVIGIKYSVRRNQRTGI